MRLTVSMIVRLEESCLATCLESVKDADELVVIDTRLPSDPPDRTREIAESFGAKVYDFPWTDDFAATRNEALAHCTGDWILSIDADEELEPGGIDIIRMAIEKAGPNTKSIDVQMVSSDGSDSFFFPRVFKRCPEVFWEGSIHNYLNVSSQDRSDVKIVFGYSETHKKDPDRALRILTKVLTENPKAVRETYYLAREYWYRKDYTTAAKWYADYLTRATWAPEIADAWLMSARCLWYMQNGDLARDACLQAIKINANFKEAELFMAEMSGPKNSARWKQIAETADNSDVLFVRTSSKEKDSKFYDKLFAEHRDLSRYHAIYQSISAAAENCRVLDIGCGIALLAGYVPWYAGFDFAEQTIAKARAAGRNVWVGNALEKCNYREADLYVATEVLEHIDRDVDVIHNIPSGKRVIFTVPSFDCEGHVRTYDEAKVINLYARLLDIHRISRFVWRNDAWVQSTHKTEPYILLVEAVRR